MWMDADGDGNGYGDDCDGSYDEVGDLEDDRAYWRRRFFILCGGVVALGVCAWLFPGAHQPSARTAAAARASMAAIAKRQALPSAAYGSAWPDRKAMAEATDKASPAVSPAASGRLANAMTAKAKPKPKIANKVGTAYHPKPLGSGRVGAAGACAPADIVLSLFTSQPSYAKGTRPKFSVYAVSTSAGPCTLPYGTGSVQVVVTRRGHVVWDSAACKSSAPKSVRFTLGVPQVLTMAWDPAAAGPAGCAGSLPAGASGTLDAVAMSNGQSSPVRTFKLGSLPVLSACPPTRGKRPSGPHARLRPR